MLLVRSSSVTPAQEMPHYFNYTTPHYFNYTSSLQLYTLDAHGTCSRGYCSDSTDTAEDMELNDGDSATPTKWSLVNLLILKTSSNNLYANSFAKTHIFVGKQYRYY